MGTAIVFPGQGSQRHGMAQDFCAVYPAAQQVFDVAAEVTGINIQSLCNLEGEALDCTEVTQPAILTAEIALFSVIRSQISELTYYAGHSLGEYAALVAAGVVDFADALHLVTLRGSLMKRESAGKGSMIAVIGPDATSPLVEDAIRTEGAEVANYNSPQQIVVSGDSDSIDRVNSKVGERFPSLRFIALNVSAPFHCSLMRGIEDQFRDFLNSMTHKMNLKKAKTVFSNFTGRPHTEESLIENLVLQIANPVQWTVIMEALRIATSDIIEIGPRRILGRFLSEVGIESRSITDVRSLNRNLLKVAA